MVPRWPPRKATWDCCLAVDPMAFCVCQDMYNSCCLLTLLLVTSQLAGLLQVLCPEPGPDFSLKRAAGPAEGGPVGFQRAGCSLGLAFPFLLGQVGDADGLF